MPLARPRSETAVAPAKFAHVVFRTRQKDAMVAWWTTVLQAKVQHENAILAFLTYDDEHHRVAMLQLPDLPDRPEGSVGLEHVAYTYASLGDLLDTYERLRDHGIEPYWTINHGPTTSLYYRDPDGNQVELQIDNFPTAEALNAFFHSDTFARNPIGVNFDPERLVARYRAGDPVEELVQQGAA
jgi:catechol-2,3-dioxygenase